jgi:hypothetical protein
VNSEISSRVKPLYNTRWLIIAFPQIKKHLFFLSSYYLYSFGGQKIQDFSYFSLYIIAGNIVGCVKGKIGKTHFFVRFLTNPQSEIHHPQLLSSPLHINDAKAENLSGKIIISDDLPLTLNKGVI